MGLGANLLLTSTASDGKTLSASETVAIPKCSPYNWVDLTIMQRASNFDHPQKGLRIYKVYKTKKRVILRERLGLVSRLIVLKRKVVPLIKINWLRVPSTTSFLTVGKFVYVEFVNISTFTCLNWYMFSCGEGRTRTFFVNFNNRTVEKMNVF